MAQDLKSQIDAINSGAPIPPIEPGDLRAALLLFSDLRSVLGHDTTSDTKAGPLRGIGYLSDDIAARCRPGADVFTIGVRAALADVILQLARAKPDRSGGADDDSIIQAVATMPLIGSDLKDPTPILLRLDEMSRR
jgi:hypothetical protein